MCLIYDNYGNLIRENERIEEIQREKVEIIENKKDTTLPSYICQEIIYLIRN